MNTLPVEIREGIAIHLADDVDYGNLLQINKDWNNLSAEYKNYRRREGLKNKGFQRVVERNNFELLKEMVEVHQIQNTYDGTEKFIKIYKKIFKPNSGISDDAFQAIFCLTNLITSLKSNISTDDAMLSMTNCDPALYFAVKNNNLDMVKYLLENSIVELNILAYYVAIESDNLDLLKYLYSLSENYNINYILDNAQLVQFLKKKYFIDNYQHRLKGNCIQRSILSSCNCSVLLLAINTGNLKIIDYLIEKDLHLEIGDVNSIIGFVDEKKTQLNHEIRSKIMIYIFRKGTRMVNPEIFNDPIILNRIQELKNKLTYKNYLSKSEKTFLS